MRFKKDDIIIRVAEVYPNGAMTVDGYEPDGTLLAHPLGGGFQFRIKSTAEKQFRIVLKSESEGGLWRRAKFAIEEADTEFEGWTNGKCWNGWAMPYFEFVEAQRVVELLTDPKGKYDAVRDCFISINGDGEEEIWEAVNVSLLGGVQIKVYGIGAGSWIWDEMNC
jgi:hypothetical protein